MRSMRDHGVSVQGDREEEVAGTAPMSNARGGNSPLQNPTITAHIPHTLQTLKPRRYPLNSESLIFVGSPAADCPWHLSSEIRFLKSKADSPSKATTPPKRHKSKLPNPSHLIRAWQVRERVHRAVCRFRSLSIQHFWNCGRDCLGRRDRSLGERHLLG